MSRLRKPPRIISRRRPVQFIHRTAQDEDGPSVSGELAEELADSGVAVKQGMMIMMRPDEDSEDNFELSESPPSKKTFVDAVSKIPHVQPYQELPLPGTADEVESYPCRFCPDRVFLTGFGLERHARDHHTQEQIEHISSDITKISDEWKRRESERAKQKDRLIVARLRQGAITAALKNVVVASSSKGTGSLVANEAFQACRTCGILVNAFHPTAMENHLRAHRKNEELRTQLMHELGEDMVNRLTCHECQLVFTDDSKLLVHAESMHVRKRKYVCKWCGTVCLSMTELNVHKADVHGVPSSAPRPSRHISVQPKPPTKGARPPLGIRESHTEPGSFRPQISEEELPCRTLCSVCGLVMVRPSLLIRHMLRVHNLDKFEAVLETRGLPSFRVSVSRGGRIEWFCCELSFSDRNAFMFHRRSSHELKLDDLDDGTSNLDNDGVPTVAAETEAVSSEFASDSQLAMGEGEMYMLLVDSEEDKNGKRDIHLGSETMTLSLEEFELLRQQYGDELNDMMILIDEDRGEEQGFEEVAVETFAQEAPIPSTLS